MSKRTVSELSRLIGVSRVTIYRRMQKLGINRAAIDEFSEVEWNRLLKELAPAAECSRAKRVGVKGVENAGRKGVEQASLGSSDAVKLLNVDISTVRERLDMAKQEYDYNRNLISVFQAETDEYVKTQGKTTMVTHNGSTTAIPSITNLEKYVKLNIALSKLISELETVLRLDVGGDTPFV